MPDQSGIQIDFYCLFPFNFFFLNFMLIFWRLRIPEKEKAHIYRGTRMNLVGVKMKAMKGGKSNLTILSNLEKL